MKAKLILLKKTDGRTNFMIRLSAHGKKAYRAIEVPFSEKDWHYEPKKRLNRLRFVKRANTSEFQNFLKYESFVNKEEKKYNQQINELIMLGNPFSFDKVFSLVDGGSNKQASTVFELFKARIEELKENEQLGTAVAYQGTFSKIKSILKKDLLWIELDDEVLLGLRKKMTSQSLSNSTISIHLRTIRAIYNLAIKRRIVSVKDYPFVNPDIMSRLVAPRRSIAISRQQVDKIRELKKELNTDCDLWTACSYFLFGYLGRGINFQDMARLKWENISKGRVSFVRYKTRAKVQELTSFGITDEIAEILNYYRRQNTDLLNPYVFPILNPFHDTESKKFHRIKKMRSILNKSLKEVGKLIKSNVEITTYIWRHSFASIAKIDLNVPVPMISEMLGHNDIATTEHYLKQFPDKDKDKAVIGL